ncbi:MAG: histidine ammonia-lyase [Saprospiraceae bacterium]
MNSVYLLGTGDCSIQDIKKILHGELKLEVEPALKLKLQQQRTKLEAILDESDQAIYGINTGFGALCNTIIADDKLNELQSNLVRSHACGFGALVPIPTVRLVLLLKIICLCKGYSAVRWELIEFLIQLFNQKITPQIPEMGSLGASGDLAPLAHLSLPCIGEGILNYESKEYPSFDLLSKLNIPIPYLKAKEGLALLNGTQYSLALLFTAWDSAKRSYHNSNLNVALSMEAFNCNLGFLHPKIHEIRKQAGQIHAANEISIWLDGSDLNTRDQKSVQDPYSFRCAPQVHGASYDVIRYCKSIIENEINSVTDNPLMLSETEIVSGGNFHAQPLALASDFLCLAVAELANISERRLYQLVCGLRGLPDFLTSEAGLNSGYMIVQYAAAAAVSLNKQYCSPSSIDSIISSKGQEDHVSMAANAGIRCNKIAQQTEMVLAMEWLTATRAMHFRQNYKTGAALKNLIAKFQEIVPFQAEDHIPSLYYQKSIDFLKTIAH